MLALNIGIKQKDVFLGLGTQFVTMQYNKLTVLIRFRVHALDLISRQ